MELASYRVWVCGHLAYHPVRKAASSSLQHAFGGRPVDMRDVEKGILHFTMVRNPFDRLASLFANNLDYDPFQRHGIHKGMSLDDFVDRVCETREPLCDHHLWEANHVVPRSAEVFYFEDIFREINRMNNLYGLDLKLEHIGLTRTNKPRFNEMHLDQLTWRYRHDLARFYENNTDPRSCRLRGETKARLRQKDAERVNRLNSVGSRTASTHSPPKR